MPAEQTADSIIADYLARRDARDGDVPAEMLLRINITEAILLEREACAKIADEIARQNDSQGVAESIAEIIRDRDPDPADGPQCYADYSNDCRE